VNTHFGRWTRLVDVYSTHRWSNEEIETQFPRDGGIAPVDVLFNAGSEIRRWRANRKWLLFDVCDKSCSNTRHATILPLKHMMYYQVRRKYAVVVKPALVFSSSVVSVFLSSSDMVGAVCLHLTVVAMWFGFWHRDLYRNPEVTCMSGTDTTRNQYSFLNMPALRSLPSTLLAVNAARLITNLFWLVIKTHERE
jgi:hypothetical protein